MGRLKHAASGLTEIAALPLVLGKAAFLIGEAEAGWELIGG